MFFNEWWKMIWDNIREYEKFSKIIWVRTFECSTAKNDCQGIRKSLHRKKMSIKYNFFTESGEVYLLQHEQFISDYTILKKIHQNQ